MGREGSIVGLSPASTLMDSTPPLAVGQRWRRRDGKEVVIDKHDTEETAYPFCADGLWYAASGFYAGSGLICECDLIELLEPAPAPAPVRKISVGYKTASEIPELIRTGAAPFYVLVVSDDLSNGGGNPIVWETSIPTGSSLQAVLQQQRRMGSFHGTTYVAECYIIPELTEVPF